jgi:hypothetical protein
MKIPTLIGIAVIVALIVTGALFYLRKDAPTGSDIKVTDLTVVNVSDTSATIVWQTSVPSTGSVLYGENPDPRSKQNDNRDHAQQQNRITHFVTVNNLKPKTKYFYRILNNNVSHPQTAQEFVTADKIPETDEISFSFIKPIKGTVLSTNLNPVDESLVFLKIPGAQSIATFSSTAGNFILSLKTILNENLSGLYLIASETQAQITIVKGNLKSDVKMTISDDTVNLPPIALGNNLDLTDYVTPPITAISIGQNSSVKLDFNDDNKINSLDLAILRTKSSAKSLPSKEDLDKFDITRDGVIDQSDVDSFSRSLTTGP